MAKKGATSIWKTVLQIALAVLLIVGGLNVFLNAVICGLVFLYYASNVEKRIESESIQYLFGTYIPLINMVLSILAMRWIKKDIDLIKSVDRLR